MDHTSTSEQTLPRRCARVARAVLSRRLPIAARRPPLHELLRVRVREPHLLLRCEYEYEYDSVCSMIAKRSSATVGVLCSQFAVLYSILMYSTVQSTVVCLLCTVHVYVSFVLLGIRVPLLSSPLHSVLMCVCNCNLRCTVDSASFSTRATTCSTSPGNTTRRNSRSDRA